MVKLSPGLTCYGGQDLLGTSFSSHGDWGVVVVTCWGFSPQRQFHRMIVKKLDFGVAMGSQFLEKK